MMVEMKFVRPEPVTVESDGSPRPVSGEAAVMRPPPEAGEGCPAGVPPVSGCPVAAA